MKFVEHILKNEVEEIEILIRKIKKNIRLAPKGHVRVSKKGKRLEFYYTFGKDGEKRNGRYMRKSERNLALKIIQRDYELQLLDVAERRLKILNNFLKNYEKTSLEKVYEKTNRNRRGLIYTTVIPDEEYIKQWQGVTYEGNINYAIKGEIITEKGEHVRSKSEKIIADKLYMLGIPYRYEYPITLDNNITMYPDFTILKVETREEIYLEHFGLMDDQNYVEKVLRKLDTYARNGIHLGVNLLITYETNKNLLNIRKLDELLRLVFYIEK